MRRREVIALIGGAAVWPIRAGAQQGLPVIGVLGSTSLADGLIPSMPSARASPKQA